MSSRSKANEDPTYAPGGGYRPKPGAQKRSTSRNRKIPTSHVSPAEPIGVIKGSPAKGSRSQRGRPGSAAARQQSPAEDAQVQALEQQIAQLKAQNTQLQTALHEKDAELQAFKAIVPANSQQSPSQTFDTAAAAYYQQLHPLTPTHPEQNHTQIGYPAYNNHYQAVSALQAADLTQWQYPDIQLGYGYHLPYLTPAPQRESAEIPLVFTPFAAVTSPREPLFSPDKAAGTGAPAGQIFAAWRPREGSLENWDETRNNHGYGNGARDLTRMVSSPAVLNHGSEAFAGG